MSTQYGLNFRVLASSVPPTSVSVSIRVVPSPLSNASSRATVLAKSGASKSRKLVGLSNGTGALPRIDQNLPAAPNTIDAQPSTGAGSRRRIMKPSSAKTSSSGCGAEAVGGRLPVSLAGSPRSAKSGPNVRISAAVTARQCGQTAAIGAATVR